ncbi:MAG: glutathione ABC transporter substrate-binding protein [Spirochaetaceae bacterium]|nr:MAG: glutathione ABC transporter substrate-binding protein [Spirochaetaceae bacterium]
MMVATVLVTLIAAFVVAPVFSGGRSEAPPAAVRDTLTIAIGAEPESLDPVKMTSAPAATVGEHVVERLIYMEEDGTLTPMLAESWSANPESTVWNFEIRQGVRFHDGAPLNAEAVVMNLRRFVNPEVGAAYAFLLGSVQSIDAVGEYTVQLQLSQPFAPILSHLSHSFIGIVSPNQIRDLSPTGTFEIPIGTGPYKMDSWNRGERVRMSVNNDYWGNVPQIPNLVINFIPESSARMVALETGEADAVMFVPPQDAARLDRDPNINVVNQTSVRQIYIGFNNQKAPFDNPLVRRALNHAVDKQAIVDGLFQGAAFVADAPVANAIFGHTSAGPYEFNPQRARQLLAEAGFPNGFDMTLHHPTGRYPLDSTVAEAVQDMLSDVGINATLETREWSSYLTFTAQPVDQADYDAYLLGWGTVTLDSDYGLYALLHSRQWNPNGNNRGFYRNDRVDDLLDRARVETNPAAREQMYGEAIRLIWDDAPWIYLYNEGQINAVRTGVEGLIHHPLENLSAWDAYFTD